MSIANPGTALNHFHPIVHEWFDNVFEQPTEVQALSWPAITAHKNTLLLAPTGSGKTLAAFLTAIDRIMFGQIESGPDRGVHTLYISPLKALGVDIERNLRSPLAGINAIATRESVEHRVPTVGIRSGDTPQADRRKLQRHPPDILITTPESLYLILTSQARDTLSSVTTVIIDEIHSMVPTKRGSHLFLSLERLEHLRRKAGATASVQRIGLSATQRPLHEVARLLGGCEAELDEDRPPQWRPVEIVQTPGIRPLELCVEVPVDDMSQLSSIGSKELTGEPEALTSIWPAIYPRLAELVRQHRSTMIFVNNRRLAERLAHALNEIAEEPIARAHHGSIAKETRLEIEDQLKQGALPAIVATSSLELGIDMGAVDLVIQVEAPPSIASGIQRIGRSGHQVGATPKGVIFPKFRGDLLACAAAIKRIKAGEVEESFYPRNPLDILAQQIVAEVSLGEIALGDLFQLVRCTAPFVELTRATFENVLDLLAGRYPSDEFRDLRPRITWDRIRGTLLPRSGGKRLAVVNAGTIPDRGLFGVFLADGEANSPNRVGELDEEMVFETNVGEVFLLGASSWKVVDITHDRVLVIPAPGEPGRMPFWHGDGPGRPLEFGQAVGNLTQQLATMKSSDAVELLKTSHELDDRAAINLVNYVHEQLRHTDDVPSDTCVVVESFLDELGDWRIAVLTPFGTRVHAPWATAVAARLRQEGIADVDLMWTDDGMVFRIPETERVPEIGWFFPDADDVEEQVVRELGGTALFAGRFRENAGRALLLPRKYPGKRTPLWMQRRRSADLLSVVAKFRNFPIMLETYRECLRDVFDVPGLVQTLRSIEQRTIRIHAVETKSASPFASTLTFNYTANFLYNDDTPLAERRAMALSLDYSHLRELLGHAELRDLFDLETIEQLERSLQRMDGSWSCRDSDSIHDLLLQLGDLSLAELLERAHSPHSELSDKVDPADSQGRAVDQANVQSMVQTLIGQRRCIAIKVRGEQRFIACENAARYRDAIGIVLPPGLPDAFLDSVANPLPDLVSLYARTHGPFRAEDVAARLGVGLGPVREVLIELARNDRVLEGEFLPHSVSSSTSEWCDYQVLRSLKRRSLSRLRHEIEPVSPSSFAILLAHWQGINEPKVGLDGVLDVIEQLQGLPLPASEWESTILTARIKRYQLSDLDELISAGEVVWRGIEPLGTNDGRIAFYLTDQFAELSQSPTIESLDDTATHIQQYLSESGASFFDDILSEVGGFPPDTLHALWNLVWSGLVTNDSLMPVRSFSQSFRATKKASSRRRYRTRRTSRLPGSEGRWSLLNYACSKSDEQRHITRLQQVLNRYGVVTKQLIAHELPAGGFAGAYPTLKIMEETGQVRRGYFVDGQGALQFALPGADDVLRTLESKNHSIVLAATDPANPYGIALPWPKTSPDSGLTNRLQRAAGARVFLHNGSLVGYMGRSGTDLTTFIDDDEPLATQQVTALVELLKSLATHGRPLYVRKVDQKPVDQSSLPLTQAGFRPGSRGYLYKAGL